MKTVVIYPGRFQPFCRHHFEVYSKLKENFGESNVFIATSDKTEKDKSPFTFEEKERIITQYGINPNFVVKTKQPYSPLEILNNFDQKQTICIFATSHTDSIRFSPLKKDGSPAYLQFVTEKMLPFEKHAYIMPIKDVSIEVNGTLLSGTNVRNKLLAQENPLVFEQVFGWYDADVAKMVYEKIKSNSSLFRGNSFNKIENIWERGDLTFRQFEFVVENLLANDHTPFHFVHEKTDGINLFVTCRNEEVLFARNKKEIQEPLNQLDFIQKFADKGDLYDVMTSATSELKEVLKDFTLDSLFFNIDIISPKTRNVIYYGEKPIIHFHNLCEFSQDGLITFIDWNIDSLLHVISGREKNWRLLTPNKVKIENDPEFIKVFKGRLNEFLQENNLTPHNKISDYTKKKWREYLNEQGVFDGFILDGLCERFSTDTPSAFPLSSIKGDVIKKRIKEIDGKRSAIHRRLINEFVDLCTRVGIGIVNDIKNPICTVHEECRDAIKKDLVQVFQLSEVELKEKSGLLDEVIAVDYENNIPVCEGIVFGYNEGVFKITGIFSNINQLIAINRYK